MDRIKPHREVLPSCPARETIGGPDFEAIPEHRRRADALELRKRLCEPAFHALRKPRRLRDQFLRFVQAALVFVSPAKQKQGLTVAAAQFQRFIQISDRRIELSANEARVTHVEKRVAPERIDFRCRLPLRHCPCVVAFLRLCRSHVEQYVVICGQRLKRGQGAVVISEIEVVQRSRELCLLPVGTALRYFVERLVRYFEIPLQMICASQLK